VLLPRRCSSEQAERPVEARKVTGSTPVSGTTSAPTHHAPFGYGLVSCPFKAEERVRVPHGVQLSGSSVGRERRSDTAEGGGSIPPRPTTCQRHWPCSSVARAPACRAGGHGFESRHGRLCHDVPRGICSVGRAPVLQAGGQGFDSPILHSLNMSGGVAERYCSSLLASRRFTRGWGFESLRLRNGQQPVPWRSWCNGNTVVCDSAIDGFNSLRSPKCPCSATDSAPVSGTGGCRFESCRWHLARRHQPL
jgi:hypothetical protein